MSGISILIVEDDIHLLHHFSKALKRAGYNVTAASGTAKAREFLSHQSFQVVVCDLDTELQDSLDMLRDNMPQLEANHTYTVALSTNSADRETSRNNGIHMYLNKPLLPSTIIGCLAQFIPA